MVKMYRDIEIQKKGINRLLMGSIEMKTVCLYH